VDTCSISLLEGETAVQEQKKTGHPIPLCAKKLAARERPGGANREQACSSSDHGRRSLVNIKPLLGPPEGTSGQSQSRPLRYCGAILCVGHRLVKGAAIGPQNEPFRSPPLPIRLADFVKIPAQECQESRADPEKHWPRRN
jgi:hypothetical protein